MKRLALLLLIAAGGCSAPQQSEIPPGPAGYRSGYSDGCSTGYHAAGNPYYRFVKDHGRYSGDGDYRTGWEDGFRVCKGKYDSLG